MDETGKLLRGPRPLRSSTNPSGLTQLSVSELKQLGVDNNLLLRGLWLCLPVAMHGGSVVLEHPAPPIQNERASIWRTSVVLLFLRNGNWFRRHTFRQGHHGAVGPKPTTFLYANCPIKDVLDENANLQMNAATDKLIGKDSSGNFRTSRAKEYPENLCRCLATAFWRQIQGRSIVEDCDDLDPLASELAWLSG